jgi:aldose 1-epimerase
MMGYPFCLDVSVAYELGGEGLVVATTATNIGGTRCPYGCGQHAYLSPGTGLIDACTLQLAARTRILTDNERQLPTGRERVAGTPFDFSAGKRLGGQKLDFAFTDLTRDESRCAWVGLSAPDEHVVQLWVDEHYPILELYTGDTLEPERRRRGLGTEPMTCPPNAFRSGDGLLRLS